MKKVVAILRAHGSNMPGDIAEFPDHEADLIVAAGAGRYHAPAQETPAGPAEEPIPSGDVDPIETAMEDEAQVKTRSKRK